MQLRKIKESKWKKKSLRSNNPREKTLRQEKWKEKIPLRKLCGIPPPSNKSPSLGNKRNKMKSLFRMRRWQVSSTIASRTRENAQTSSKMRTRHQLSDIQLSGLQGTPCTLLEMKMLIILVRSSLEKEENQSSSKNILTERSKLNSLLVKLMLTAELIRQRTQLK